MSRQFSIQWLETVDSTNAWLKQNISSKTVACASMHQKNGRGRLGRQWDSKEGEMLALSICQAGPVTPVASLLAGCAVQKAIEELTHVCCMLKWPNDLLANGKKVCGILCESCVKDQQTYMIIGIGVNLKQSAQHFKDQNLPYATSLKIETGSEVSSQVLAEEIVKQWKSVWQQYCQKGFTEIKDYYEKHCINIKRDVRVLDTDGNPLYQGMATGISEEGLLQIQTDEGMKECNAGEVSVRGIYGYGE